MKKIVNVLLLVVGLVLAFPQASHALEIGISGRPVVAEKAELDQISVIFGQAEAKAWMFAWHRGYPMERVYIRAFYLTGQENMVGTKVYFRDSENTEYVVIELTYEIWDMRAPTALEKFVDHLLNRPPIARAILSDWQQGSWIEYKQFEEQKKTAFSEQMENRVGWYQRGYN